MPDSRKKLRKQSRPTTGSKGKVSGGTCQHTGKLYFSSLSVAKKLAMDDEESRSCAYCRGAHNWPAKRRKASHGPQGGKRRGKR